MPQNIPPYSEENSLKLITLLKQKPELEAQILPIFLNSQKCYYYVEALTPIIPSPDQRKLFLETAFLNFLTHHEITYNSLTIRDEAIFKAFFRGENPNKLSTTVDKFTKKLFYLPDISGSERFFTILTKELLKQNPPGDVTPLKTILLNTVPVVSIPLFLQSGFTLETLIKHHHLQRERYIISLIYQFNLLQNREESELRGLIENNHPALPKALLLVDRYYQELVLDYYTPLFPDQIAQLLIELIPLTSAKTITKQMVQHLKNRTGDHLKITPFLTHRKKGIRDVAMEILESSSR